ncbi:MAG: YoaK family protein [Candidatus Aquilonibacter sp.]
MREADYALMPLLFGLTFISGLVDAVSFLRLGHTFVANMTGNLVLLGFAIGGASGISIVGSIVAIGSFMIGGIIGGRLNRRHGENGAHLLSVTTFVKIFFMLGAAAIAWFFGYDGFVAYVLTAVLAISMGLQNAVVRGIGVADITTTVVTQTIIGIAMDSTLAGGNNTRVRRRVTAVVVMFAGALIGAVIVLRLGVPAALVAAAVALAVFSAWGWRLKQITQSQP